MNKLIIAITLILSTQVMAKNDDVMDVSHLSKESMELLKLSIDICERTSQPFFVSHCHKTLTQVVVAAEAHGYVKAYNKYK